MNIRVYLLILIFSTQLDSCKRNTNDITIDKKNTQEQYLNILYNDGYRFYKKINLFDRIGEDSIDIKNKKQITTYPFYGFKIDIKKIEIITFYSNSLEGSRYYKIMEEYLISTDVYTDEELNSLSYRTIKIISNGLEIDYEYSIDENYEKLYEIDLKYKNGIIHTYSSKTSTYQDYTTQLKESDMKTKYPTFKLVENEK